jgi:tetratricopeptide (TPR) repeat protein
VSVIACKNYIKHLFFALILSVSSNILAQPVDNDTKLANHYFDKGEFEKAEIYYERAYKNYESQLYYDRYFQCLFNLEKFEECEKLVEKRIKKDPYSIDNQFKLASVYKANWPKKCILN